MGRNRAGKAVLNAAGGKALPAVPLVPGADRLAVVSTAGYMLVFPLPEIQEYPKGKGNKLIQLRRGEELGRVVLFADAVALPPRRGKQDINLSGPSLQAYERKRGARGRLLPRNAALPEPRGEGKKVARALQEDLF